MLVSTSTSDIVWLIEQTVTLPDGSKQNVLVPQLYVKVQPGDLDASGALLAGKDVNINLSGDLTNTGTIAGRNVVSLTADNVNNLGGRIGGNDVSVAARQDLNNIGGSIGAVNSLSATAGRDLNIQTTTQTTTQSTTTRAGIANNSRTNIDRIAGLYVSGANSGKGGTLIASAGRDFNIVAGEVSNAGSGTTSLSVGNHFTLATVNTGEQNNLTWNADNHLNYGNTQNAGSTIQGGGNVNLQAGKDLTATAANVQATQALGVQAGGNVNILAGQATQTQDQAYKHTSSGFLSSTTTTTRESSQSTTAIASSIEGNSVTRTGDAQQGIAKIFDAAKVSKEVNAQIAITKACNRVHVVCLPKGLTVSDAFRIMLTRIATEKALPFEPLLPNETTIAAMREARSGGLKSFDSVGALMTNLHESD